MRLPKISVESEGEVQEEIGAQMEGIESGRREGHTQWAKA